MPAATSAVIVHPDTRRGADRAGFREERGDQGRGDPWKEKCRGDDAGPRKELRR